MLNQVDIKDWKGLTLQLNDVALVNFVVGCPEIGKTRLLDYLNMNEEFSIFYSYICVTRNMPSCTIRDSMLYWLEEYSSEFYGKERLLIDNIEAGLHHTQYKEVVEAVFNTARKGVQFFITTQSYEMLETVSEVLKEMKVKNDEMYTNEEVRLFSLFSLVQPNRYKCFCKASFQGAINMNMELRGSAEEVGRLQK
jgi:AAA15 family ATPase/GTPase